MVVCIFFGISYSVIWETHCFLYILSMKIETRLYSVKFFSQNIQWKSTELTPPPVPVDFHRISVVCFIVTGNLAKVKQSFFTIASVNYCAKSFVFYHMSLDFFKIYNGLPVVFTISGVARASIFLMCSAICLIK